MANRFDETNAPEGEPSDIVAGDFVSWKRTGLVADYPPASFSAEYVARISAGGTSEIKIAGTERDSYYWFTAASSVSSAFFPGRYYWQLEVTETATSNRVVVDRGEFRVIVDLDFNGTDPRIHAEVMLDKIEAVLENRADGDVNTYTIAGRSLTKMTPQELINWRDVYRREVASHRRKVNMKLGKKGRATILGRFI